jgi:AraC-like DNA-binding protein
MPQTNLSRIFLKRIKAACARMLCMNQLLDTAQVEPHRRAEYWSDMVCGTYVQLDCTPQITTYRKDFKGSIAVADLAALQFTHVTSQAQCVQRTQAKIASDPEDYFLVSIQATGQGMITQDGREAWLQRGDFALYDSTRPYTLKFDGDFQQYVLKLPGKSLRTAVRDTEQLTATAVSGLRGAGHLMINMITTLAQDIDTLAHESAAAVADSVTNILIAGLSALPAARRQPVSQLHTYQLERIKSAVAASLRDPHLNVAMLSALLRTSASTLHRTWTSEACSLSDYIWAQRLEHAKRDLCNPGFAACSVSEIAFSWGFNDAAHFSRAFRSRFACSPRDMRVS